MYSVQEINDIRETESIRADWDRLLLETPNADFFRTLDWLEIYWKHHSDNKRLRILSIQENNSVIGLLPLVISQRTTKIGKFRVLEFPLDYWGTFYGPIGSNTNAIYHNALQHLLSTGKDWDYIDLRWLHVSPDSSLVSLTESAQSTGLSFTPQADDEIAVADISKGWEQYWSSRSGNCRSNCRRNAKKIAAKGEIEFIRYRPLGNCQNDADPRWDLYDEVLSLANKSWQGKSHDGTTMSHEKVSNFLKDMHQKAAETGHLDLNLMRVNGKPIAFNYNYHHQGYVSSLRLGFDPDFSKCGVGTVLTHHMLEDSCNRGDQLIDFLPGSMSVKRPWQTSIELSMKIEHVPFRLGRVALIWGARNIANRFRAKQTDVCTT